MQYKKLIQSEIDFTKTFRLIAQAYEEIAVMKMRKVRGSVLQARDYFAKLSDVFIDVKKAYKRQKKESSFAKASADKEEILKRKQQVPVNTLRVGKSLSTLPPQTHPQGAQSSSTLPEGEKYQELTSEKLDKSVSVFLSANTTLYGDIINRIFKLFLQNIDKKDTDVIIIGRLGRRLYDELEKKKPYLYFELPDFEVSIENLRPVIYHLVKYKTILVYYGKFENIINQQAAVSNISGDQPFNFEENGYEKLENSNRKLKIENSGRQSPISKTSNQTLATNFQKAGEISGLGTKFLFEPSLESILAFFEDLITSALFRQTVYETQLARWASRIMAMEKAQVNIETQIKRLHFLDTKINRADQQKKQLERLSGISLWRR